MRGRFVESSAAKRHFTASAGPKELKFDLNIPLGGQTRIIHLPDEMIVRRANLPPMQLAARIRLCDLWEFSSDFPVILYDGSKAESQPENAHRPILAYRAVRHGNG